MGVPFTVGARNAFSEPELSAFYILSLFGNDFQQPERLRTFYMASYRVLEYYFGYLFLW